MNGKQWNPMTQTGQNLLLPRRNIDSRFTPDSVAKLFLHW
jgi:hypothetical protein